MDSGKITTLERERFQLPQGSISKKTVNGKTYYYHRVQRNGKRVEKYIPADKVESVNQATQEGKPFRPN